MSREPYDPIESIAESLRRIADVLEEWAKPTMFVAPPEMESATYTMPAFTLPGSIPAAEAEWAKERCTCNGPDRGQGLGVWCVVHNDDPRRLSV